MHGDEGAAVAKEAHRAVEGWESLHLHQLKLILQSVPQVQRRPPRRAGTRHTWTSFIGVFLSRNTCCSRLRQ